MRAAGNLGLRTGAMRKPRRTVRGVPSPGAAPSARHHICEVRGSTFAALIAQVRRTQLVPVDDIASAITTALGDAGPRARLCVLPQGPQTIPYVG